MIATIKAPKESAYRTITAPEYIQAPATNDDILSELEARYGEIVAWWIIQRLPKTKGSK
jgi:hypothetical protein